MRYVTKDQEIEEGYIAMLINNEKLIDISQIKPYYLQTEDNQKILSLIKECYKKYKNLNIVNLYKITADFNWGLYQDLAHDTFYYGMGANLVENMKIYETAIMQNYKNVVIGQLNNKLILKEIRHEEFIEKIKKIDEIKIDTSTNVLTMDEIDKNINDSIGIEFKSYPKLSSNLKLVQGDFMIIGGLTGGGKSSLMLNFLEDLMNDYQIIYFNMEMSKSTVYKRLIAIKSKVPVYDTNAPKSDHQRSLIVKAKQELESAKIVIEHKANNIEKIKNTVINLKNKNKHTIIFIDHLGLTRIENDKSLYQQITEIVKELRQICLDYDCTIIAASQFNRNAPFADRIELSMLKDSGEIENSARKVLIIQKSNMINEASKICEVEIDIAKNSDGVTGTIKFEYDKKKQIFTEKKYDEGSADNGTHKHDSEESKD